MNKRLPGFVGRETELGRLEGWLGEVARSGRGKAIAALAAVRTRVPLTNNATLLVGVSRNGFTGNARPDIELGPEQLLNAWTIRRRGPVDRHSIMLVDRH